MKTREQTHAHAHTHARASSTETLLSLSLFPSLSLSLPMWHRRHFVVFQPLSPSFFAGERRPKKGEKGPKSACLAAQSLKRSSIQLKKIPIFPALFFFFLSAETDDETFYRFVLPEKERETERTRNFTRSADILLLVNSRRRGLNNASNKKNSKPDFL